MMNLKEFIRDIPDFPKAGILFRDVTPLLASPKAFYYAIDELASRLRRVHIEAIVGIESRGFIFGAPIAIHLGIPFVPIRKPGKLPSKTHSVQYDLEYATSELHIHCDALHEGTRVAIVDDLLATGGTAAAAGTLCEATGAQVITYAFCIELSVLGGRKKLGEVPVEVLTNY